jgi:hypothetical protein
VAEPATVDRLRLGDHVYWTFDSDRERSAAMAKYARAGLRPRHKVTDPVPTSTVVWDRTARGVAA